MGVVYDPHLGGSVMVQAGTLAGNVGTLSTYRATNLALAGGTNVSLSLSGDVIYINASAGTGTAGAAFVLSNSNGVSWGTAGSVVTASVSTAYAPAVHSHTQYALNARSTVWGQWGAVISSADPGPGVVYSDWLAGSSGYFMWIQVP